MNYVKNLKKLSKKDVSIAGGKGAQLGELLKANIPVPGGFIVLTNSFEKTLEKNNLKEKIDIELKKVKEKDSKSIDNASKNIRNLISKAIIPKEIEKAILSEYDNEKLDFVAVRSSATAEDSAQASWAGELETYTNQTRKTLLDSVKKCWSSLFTPRAIFYRIEKKLSNKSISVAIVVQKMINSEVSGVCFTVHPVTKEKDKMVIEAGLGLGESVVAGEITPDNYIVNKKEMFIEDITISNQGFMYTKINRKTKKVNISKNNQENQKLDGKIIMELTKICKRIEKHYKTPQDIEWAYEKGEILIVQTRPITTL